MRGTRGGKRATCVYCGNGLDEHDECILCGTQPNVRCPECGEEYCATGLGICPICGYLWDESVPAEDL